MEDKLEEKWKSLIGEYAAALKWTRDKLKEEEEKNRKLKFIIMELTEGKGKMPEKGKGVKRNAMDFDP